MANLLIIAVGIGAGLVSALLFGVVSTGSPLAMLLSTVAPLPIFIAALGWNHLAGLVAVASGGLAMAAALHLTAGVAFVVGWALPAWWLAYLALLGRPGADGKIEWYPIGRLLVWIVLTAALTTFVGVLVIGRFSYETFSENLRRVFDALMQPRNAPAGDPPPSLTMSLLVDALPLFFALNFVFILSLNLWLAARAVRLSDRLPRPWPDIPATAMMPAVSLLALVGAIALAFAPGLAGAAGLILAGGFFAAFMLQGLAFIHDTTRRRPNRGFLLGSLYAVTLLLSQIAMPLLALLGCADAAFPLRARFRAGAAGPPSH